MIKRFFNSIRTSHLKCNIRRINWMIRPIMDNNFNINNRITGYNSCFKGICHTFIN